VILVWYWNVCADTAPTSAAGFLAQVQHELEQKAYGTLATVCGRYYAMDRDKRWERVKLAHDMLLGGTTSRASTLLSSLSSLAIYVIRFCSIRIKPFSLFV
jgi:bisphosphoglycerate-independent phosphoglycerate mutase (AlkP superfamily)